MAFMLRMDSLCVSWKKSRRRGYFLLTVLVVIILVLLSSYAPQFINDTTDPLSGTLRRSEVLQARKSLFPVIINRLRLAAQKLFNFSNATISGNDVRQKLAPTSDTKLAPVHGQRQEETESNNNGNKRSGVKRDSTKQDALREVDPLVIVPEFGTGARVHFMFQDNGSYWNGRPLELQRPGIHWLQDEQYDFIQQAIQTGGLNVTMLSHYSMEDRMLPWEWGIYSHQPLTNIREASDEKYSRVHLLNSTRSFRVGESLAIRVDVFDGFAKAKTEGGDHIRVWLKDEAQGAATAVDVRDLNNGSYLALIPLLWPGHPQIRVSLTFPKEVVRTVYYVRNIMKGLRLNSGAFVSSFASEATICSPFPFSPGYKELCNLTSLNYGLSWYCGRPFNPTLTCRHWAQIRDLEFPQPLPLTQAELQWFNRLRLLQYLTLNSPIGCLASYPLCLSGRGDTHHLRLLTNPIITINVLPSLYQAVNTSVLCKNRPKRDMWLEEAPRGFIFQHQWTPLPCTLPPQHVTQLNQCLQGKTLYMIGDSNLRHMLELLSYHRMCTPTKQLVGKKNWHSPQLCINHEYNFIVRWRTHALPFHTNADHWAPKTNQQAVGLSLDEIPSTGKYIVLIHMYLHFTTHHYSAYLERIRSMKEAVGRLLERNPWTKVVIRGPHAAFKDWDPVLGGDLQAPRYIEMLKDEFRDLYDKVYLLDFWDYTVAAESEGFHPQGAVTQQMLKVFFGYVCD